MPASKSASSVGVVSQNPGCSSLKASSLKSPSTLSRFLNVYTWSVREVIRRLRAAVRQQLQQYRPRGRRPHLQVIVDLTTLENAASSKPLST